MKSTKKDLNDIIGLLQDQGWTIRKDGSNHWSAVHPDGRRVTIPTRTGDHTGYMNAVARLRRNGVDIPRGNHKKKHLR